ncbi:MAG: DUF368 domain-containing protein [Candidatus Aenigmatarchaeota archaeon]
MDLKERVLLFLKGLLMGVAQIIPGVSAGTMALVTDIYERFIRTVDSINPLTDEKTDLEFLVVVGLGMGVSFLLLSRIILRIIESYESTVFAFFFGLIASAAFTTYRKTERVDRRTVGLGAVGFVISFLVSGLEPLGSYHALPLLFVSGFLAICAMLLPGVSGSFVMLLLGQYKYMLNALKEFWNFWMEIGAVVGGMVLAFLTFPKAVDRLFEWDRCATLSFLVGLMVGALRIPFQRITPAGTVLGNLPVLVGGGVGFLAVLHLELSMKS